MTAHPPQPPVEIPDHLKHGTSYVHRHYGCRCAECQSWRREYDQARPKKRRRGKPTRDLRKGYWYVCLGRYGVTYEEHEYTRTGICVRCGAHKGVEDYWEAQWNASEPTP